MAFQIWWIEMCWWLFKQNLDFLEDTTLSLNSKFDLLYQNVSSNMLDIHAPVTKMSKGDIKLHEKPWFTAKTQRLALTDFYTNLTKNIYIMVTICLNSYKIGL